MFSQNVNKSNTLTHTLLNEETMNRLTRDIVLLQEPWHGKIGVDYECQSTKAESVKKGMVNHKDWIIIPPIQTDKPYNVVAYIKKEHTGWNVTHRADLISHPSIMILQVMTDEEYSLVINLYNPSDNSVAPLLSTIDLPTDAKIIITGDFNLHHPDWSPDSKEEKAGSENLVNWMRTNDFTLPNKPGETTWFRGSQSLTLDLTWASNNSLNNISHWGVREDLHNGSDHLPITWTLILNHNLTPPSLPKYRMEDNLYTPWSKKFTSLLQERWTFPDYLPNETTFLDATNIFHTCMIEASDHTLQPKPPKPKPSFLFSNLCRSGVNKVRDSRRQYKLSPNETTLQELKTNTTKYKRTIRLSKKLGVAEFANKVTRDNVWRLNSWYRGARRTYTPILLDESTGEVKVYPEDKANLMHSSWFTPPKPIPGDFSFEGTNHNTRHFEPVTFREIEDTLKSTSNTSTPGSTGIGYKILKWALAAAPDKMSTIVKSSIKLGVHHPRWKSSLVVVIPKAKKPSYSDPKAWRPIQLLDTLSKLIKKIMAKRIIYEIGRHC